MNHYFSTNDVHPRDRISYMQDVACKTYVDVDCRVENGTAFCASIQSGQLGILGLSRAETDPCEVIRTKSNIATSRSDDLLISIQLEGTSTLIQDSREATLQKGNFALYDTQRTYNLKTGKGTKQLVLKLPRSSLESRIGAATGYTARAMSSANPLSRLAFGFLKLLPENSKTLTSEPAHKIAEQALDLLALAFSHECSHRGEKQTTGRGATLIKLKSVIETHFTDPDFKPTEAAILTGISVRYANQLLKEEGNSLEQYIYSRRLERCRNILSDPRSSHRTVSEISHSNGFNCASHFSRMFKNTYGTPPLEYRNTAKNQNQNK